MALHPQLSVLAATEYHILGLQMKGPIAAPRMRLHSSLELARLVQNAPLAAASCHQEALRVGGEVPDFAEARVPLLFETQALAIA